MSPRVHTENFVHEPSLPLEGGNFFEIRDDGLKPLLDFFRRIGATDGARFLFHSSQLPDFQNLVEQ